MTLSYSYAQSHEFGVVVGYGETVKDEYRHALVNPFNSDFDDYLRIGLMYYFNIPKALLNINTGLSFDNRNYQYGKSTYLRVPLGIDLNVGNKLQFIGGIGLYFSYLLSFDSDFYESIVATNNFQVGWQINAGIGYQISRRYNINIRYQNNFDITRMYTRERGSPGGGTSSEEVRGYDYFFSLSVKYKIFKK